MLSSHEAPINKAYFLVLPGLQGSISAEQPDQEGESWVQCSGSSVVTVDSYRECPLTGGAASWFTSGLQAPGPVGQTYWFSEFSKEARYLDFLVM